MWFAGGGVKGGRIVGETDEFGLNGIGERYHMRDFHATILHLLGLDQHKLFHLHNGRNEKLTDFGGNALVRFDPVTETFDEYPFEKAGATVRQILGRPGEIWGAESGLDKLVVARAPLE